MNFKIGDTVYYGSIICKITAMNSRSIIIKSEKGNIYKVVPTDIKLTTTIFKTH